MILFYLALAPYIWFYHHLSLSLSLSTFIPHELIDDYVYISWIFDLFGLSQYTFWEEKHTFRREKKPKRVKKMAYIQNNYSDHSINLKSIDIENVDVCIIRFSKVNELIHKSIIFRSTRAYINTTLFFIYHSRWT